MECIEKRVKQDQGFTLVEIIVVLVVLAILAAFTIPTMLGFVADAKGKAYIAEAREVYVAAQAVATEYSGTTDMTDGSNDTGTGGGDPWSNGLAVSLSSGEVQYRYKTFHPGDKLYGTAQVNASHQMYRYLSADLPWLNDVYDQKSISQINLFKYPDATPAGHRAAWRVTVGPGDDNIDGTGANKDQRTARVTKVVYLRDGYQVTIEGNNASVVKKYEVDMTKRETDDFGNSTVRVP